MRGVLLQVRLDSTRLPEKALLKLKDLTVIEHAMRALKQIDADVFVLVTTEESFNKPIKCIFEAATPVHSNLESVKQE